MPAAGAAMQLPARTLDAVRTDRPAAGRAASYRWWQRSPPPGARCRLALAQRAIEQEAGSSAAAQDAPRPRSGAHAQQQQQQRQGRADARLITARIKQAASLQELQRLVELHGSSFNHIHTSAALYRLAHLAPAARQPGGSSQRRPAATAAAVGQLLLPLVARHLPAFEPRHLSNVLWALASLGQPLPPGWLASYLFSCLPSLGGFGAQDTSNLLWALGRLQHRPSAAFLVALWLRSQGQLGSFKAQELSNTLHAAARLRLQPPAAWLEAWEAAAAAAAGGMTAQALSNSAWALAQLGHRPGQAWMGGFLDACLSRLPSFDAHHVSTLLVGLAALRPALQPPQQQALLQAAGSRWSYMDAQGLANTAQAAAKLGLAPEDPWLWGLAEAAVTLPPPMLGRQDVLGLVTGLAQLSAAAPAAAQCAQQVLQHAAPHAASAWAGDDLADLLVALVQLEQQPGQRQPLQQQQQQQQQQWEGSAQEEQQEQEQQQQQPQQEGAAGDATVLLLQGLQRQLDGLSPKKLAYATWGLAQLGAHHSPHLSSQLAAAAARQAGRMSAQQLPQLLWGLARWEPALQLQQGQREALAQALQQHVAALDAASLAVVLSSMRRLGFSAHSGGGGGGGGGGGNAAARGVSGAPLPAQLVSAIQQQAAAAIGCCGPGQAARLAVSLALLGIPPASAAVVQQLQQHVQAQATQLSIDEVSAILLADSQWQQQQQLLHQQLQLQQQLQQQEQQQRQLPQQEQQPSQQQQQSLLGGKASQQLWARLENLVQQQPSVEQWCRLLWALGGVKVRPSQRLLELSLAALHRLLPELSGPELCRVLMGLAKMHAAVPKSWLSEALYCLAPRLQQCSAKQLLGALRAACQFGYSQQQDAGAFARAWRVAVDAQLQAFDAGRCTELLLHLSAAGWQLPGSFLQRAMQQCAQALPSASAREVHTMVWALGRWPGMTSSYPPCQRLLEQLLAASQQQLGSYSPSDVVWALKSLAQLQHQPPDGYMQLLCAHVRANLQHYEGRLAVALIWPLAKLDYRPEEAWLGELAARICGSMSELRPQQLANVLCAFARFGFNPGQAWLGQFTQQVDRSAGALADLDHNHIQWAWAELSDTIGAAQGGDAGGAAAVAGSESEGE